MAIVQLASNTLKVTLKGHIDAGEAFANVWYWKYGQVADAEDFEEVAGKVTTAWQTNLAPMVSTACIFDGADWMDLDNVDGMTGSVPPDPVAPDNGTNALEAAPPNVSLLVTKSAANAGRRARSGRCYIVGIPETNITNTGMLTTPALTNAQAQMNTLHSAFLQINSAADQFQLIQPHWFDKPDNQEGVTVPWTVSSDSVINALTVQNRVATQRRRLRR